MLDIWHLKKLFPRPSPVTALPNSVIYIIYSHSWVTSTPYFRILQHAFYKYSISFSWGSYDILVKNPILPHITKPHQFSGFVQQDSMMPPIFHHLFLKVVLMLMMLPCPAVRISLVIGYREEGNSWFNRICFVVCPILSNYFATSQNGAFSLWHLPSGSLPSHLTKHHIFL